MATKEKIQKAIEMINDFDFEWRRSDYAYSQKLDVNAYNEMKAFVNFVKNECNNLETLLRQLWVANYNRDKNEIERINKLLSTI